MSDRRTAVPAEAERGLAIVRRSFGASLVGAYLHGSAVSGGLRRDSDVDLLVVVEQPTTHAVRAGLVSALMAISTPPGNEAGMRPLELIVFRRGDLAPPAYPARAEFVYGEWLREAFEAGTVPDPVSDPELTLVLAQARREARRLAGPEPAALLPEIAAADIRRATGDALPALLGSLEGDERNVLLTLARMWQTLVTGDFVAKDAAAAWAMPLLPVDVAAMLSLARDGYLGLTADDWAGRRQQARAAADALHRRVAALL